MLTIFIHIIDIVRSPIGIRCFGMRSESSCAKRWRRITNRRSVNAASQTGNRWVQKTKKGMSVAAASPSEIRPCRTMASLLNTRRAVVLGKYRRPLRDQNRCVEAIENLLLWHSRIAKHFRNHARKTISPKAKLTVQAITILCAISPSYVYIIVCMYI